MPGGKIFVAARSQRQSIARKALKLATKNRKKIKETEIKFLENEDAIAGVIPTVAGVITQYTNVQRGDTALTRTGNLITAVKLEFKCFVVMSDAPDFTIVRFLLIKDKQTNGVIHTTADILQSLAAPRGVITPRNRDTLKRFVILKEWILPMSGSGDSLVKRLMWTKKVNTPIRYQGNAGDITDLVSNSFSLLAITNTDVNPPSYNSHMRVYFTDV